jgi:hypothetical protein
LNRGERGIGVKLEAIVALAFFEALLRRAGISVSIFILAAAVFVSFAIFFSSLFFLV